jgi:hypothetical protein
MMNKNCEFFLLFYIIFIKNIHNYLNEKNIQNLYKDFTSNLYNLITEFFKIPTTQSDFVFSSQMKLHASFI